MTYWSNSGHLGIRCTGPTASRHPQLVQKSLHYPCSLGAFPTPGPQSPPRVLDYLLKAPVLHHRPSCRSFSASPEDPQLTGSSASLPGRAVMGNTSVQRRKSKFQSPRVGCGSVAQPLPSMGGRLKTGHWTKENTIPFLASLLSCCSAVRTSCRHTCVHGFSFLLQVPA